MIKSILLALPTYVMSTFLFPLEICETLLVSLHIFGGARTHQKEVYTGQNEKMFVYLKKRVGLDST